LTIRRYVRLLRRREFALLWGGATVSALGDGMSFIALIWLVLARGGDSTTVGWLAATYTAPVVVGGLVAGVILDRFDKRHVLAVDNLVRGLVIASIPVASALGALTTAHLFIAAAIYGLLFMTSLAGIPSVIPALVESDELVTANAMESLSYGIAGLAGPAIAGIVIALLGAPTVLALDAITYGVFVVCLLAMRPLPATEPEAAAEPAGGAEPAGSAEERGGATGRSEGAGAGESRAGGGLRPAIRFVLGSPAIVAITVIYMAINIGEGIFLVLAPVYARDVLGAGAATYGALASSFTAGALVGAFLVGAIRWPWPLGRSIAAATLATGVVLAPLLLTPSLLPSMLILALSGLFASSLTAWAQTIRMRLIPAALRGRVFALLRTLMQSTPPIGAVIAGFLLAGGDPLPTILVMVLVIAIPGAIGLFLPGLGPGPTAEPARPTEAAPSSAGE
jgi:MFS family permease